MVKEVEEWQRKRKMRNGIGNPEFSSKNLCGRSLLVKRNVINKQCDDAATKIENLLPINYSD